MTLRYSLPLASMLGTAAALAQPTLTATDHVPQDGQEFPVVSVDNYTGIGPAGANVSMDYWNMLVPNTGNRNYRWFSASVTPTSAQIPTAALLSTDGGTDTSFWAVTAQGLEQVGSRTVLEGGAVNFSDPLLELKLPCTFGTTWSDPTGSNYTVSGFPVTRTGTVTGHADAHGTLSLPGAVVYPEALRVRVRRNLTDASAIITTTRIANVTYFYVPTVRYPILKLQVDSTQINAGGWAITRRAEWMGNGFIVGLDDAAADAIAFTAFPNPADAWLTIGAAGAQGARIEVVDATGRILSVHRLLGDTHQLPVDELPPGIYHLRLVRADGQRQVQRFVVKH
ncbi:MAG: T9SS type A sorting domain-containing protein [Flavobacteriales bacterium]|nr:MAG: T9SS type A sorting domain-containing protein [Flavobacteriales bacterium]